MPIIDDRRTCTCSLSPDTAAAAAARDDAQPVARARRLPGSGLRYRLVRPEEPGEGAGMVQAAS